MNQTDDDRINQLERRLRGLQWSIRFLFVVSLLLGSAAAYAALAPMLQGGQLIDGHGNLQLLKEGTEDARVVLFKGESSSGIKLYDSLSEQRATMATSGEGSALDLRDADTNMRIMASVSEGGPQLVMADEQRKIRISMHVIDGEPRLQFFDAAGAVTFDTHDLRRSPAAADDAASTLPLAAGAAPPGPTAP